MNYEVIYLEEKTIVGLQAVTGNDDPQMPAVISNLWKSLYQDGISSQIKNKANPYAVGLYSDYTSKGYCVTVGHEVTEASNPELSVKTIPAGKFAKFSITGNVAVVVAEAWTKIWQIDLDRSYSGDFEEYLNSDCEQAEICIYISLN